MDSFVHHSFSKEQLAKLAQLAADATMLPSPIRKGADRAPKFDCNSFDIAALLLDAIDIAAIYFHELRHISGVLHEHAGPLQHQSKLRTAAFA